MRKLKRSFGSAAIPTVFAAAVTSSALLTSHAAFAETCLTRPDLRAVEGGRWYYRLDRVTKRRCWYQESARWESRNTRPWWRTTPWGTTTERDPNAATSWVASVAALISGKDANEQDNAVQNSRRTEALPERTFKRRARTAWRGDSDARIAGRPANVRRTESKATERETAVSVPPSPPTRQVPASAPSDALERERLFQDFLRWQERRSSPAR